jgi:hypothetical protein
MKKIVISILLFVLNSCAETRIGWYSGMELTSKDKLKYHLSTTILDIRTNEKDKIFVDDGESYVYYIRLLNKTTKGLSLWGTTPILPVPLVFIPLYNKRNCEISEFGVVFAITAIDKNKKDNNLILNKNNIYLLNKENNEKITPIDFESFSTGRTANRNHRPSTSIYSDIYFDRSRLQLSRSFVVQFDKTIVCRDLNKYSLIIEKDDKILVNVDIKYNRFFSKFYFAYGP